MKKIIIDFTDAKYYVELHKIIKYSFQNSGVRGFPDFYGENLDALWDCLTGFIETPVDVTIKGIKSVSPSIISKMNKIIEIFQEAERDNWGIKVNITD